MVPDTLGRLVGNPFFDRSLQKQGMICAACHFRGWKKYGPPRRDGSLDPSPEGSPHGGVTRTPFFEDSRFCSGCHQFAAPAANGKSLQNTYREWQNSRYAAEGTHCQNCHMPERRHLWRGIHDSTMVADAVSAEWGSATGGGVSLHVTNTGVGHRFPTYVTPEIRVKIEFLAGDGQLIAGSGNMAVISRKVSASTGQWVEAADTRLSPDSSMAVAARPPPGARYARGTILVIPDRFYEGVFAGLLTSSLTDSSRVLIVAAHRRASTSSYLIFDDTVQVGR